MINMAKRTGSYPYNAPEADATRIQAEAVFARKGESKPILDPKERKGNRATRRQVKAIREGVPDPSLPIMAPPVDTSRVVAREDDLYKSRGQLAAELLKARQNGDEIRTVELKKAQGILAGPDDYRRRELKRAGLPDRAYGPYTDYDYLTGNQEVRDRPPGR
jgi:hypothetical protein